VRVASKVGNLHSEFGHARPLSSRVIRYVRDGRTDRRTDGRTKAKLTAPFATGGDIITVRRVDLDTCCERLVGPGQFTVRPSQRVDLSFVFDELLIVFFA